MLEPKNNQLNRNRARGYREQVSSRPSGGGGVGGTKEGVRRHKPAVIK